MSLYDTCVIRACILYLLSKYKIKQYTMYLVKKLEK